MDFERGKDYGDSNFLTDEDSDRNVTQGNFISKGRINVGVIKAGRRILVGHGSNKECENKSMMGDMGNVGLNGCGITNDYVQHNSLDEGMSLEWWAQAGAGQEKAMRVEVEQADEERSTDRFSSRSSSCAPIEHEQPPARPVREEPGNVPHQNNVDPRRGDAGQMASGPSDIPLAQPKRDGTRTAPGSGICDRVGDKKNGAVQITVAASCEVETHNEEEGHGGTNEQANQSNKRTFGPVEARGEEGDIIPETVTVCTKQCAHGEEGDNEDGEHDSTSGYQNVMSDEELKREEQLKENRKTWELAMESGAVLHDEDEDIMAILQAQNEEIANKRRLAKQKEKARRSRPKNCKNVCKNIFK
ncbi:uncharacterized protein DS421_12g364320 [Arachis hypogaea]|nr:uncharacterized protein DS421_12g364320 [Arachis hypogaea]